MKKIATKVPSTEEKQPRKTKIPLESKEAKQVDFNGLFDTDFPP